jgi:hypothetical protein
MSTSAPQAFHLFPLLAPELRLKIWQAACTPRILPIIYANRAFTSTTPPPTLLSVSREARNEAQRVYQLFFATSTSPGKIYFNPHLDTLYLPRYREMGYDDTLRDFRELVNDTDGSGLLDEVRSIAIDHVNVDVKRPWEGYNKASLLRSFRKLEEVFLVLGNGDGGRVMGHGKGGEMVFREPRGDPECSLRIWWEFKQAFVAEERLLEEVCRESGRAFEKFELPVVKIKERLMPDCPVVRLEYVLGRMRMR